MVQKKDARQARRDMRDALLKCGIRITDLEFASIEVADFGLGDFMCQGGQMLTFFCTERISTKVIYLYPGQTLPQHWHLCPNYGKEETLRVMDGQLFLCTEGRDTLRCAKIPSGQEGFYTCRHERVMGPAEQMTLVPGKKHWFQAGPHGAVVFSFSNCAIDAIDPFENPGIVRKTVYSKD